MIIYILSYLNYHIDIIIIYIIIPKLSYIYYHIYILSYIYVVKYFCGIHIFSSYHHVIIVYISSCDNEKLFWDTFSCGIHIFSIHMSLWHTHILNTQLSYIYYHIYMLSYIYVVKYFCGIHIFSSMYSRIHIIMRQWKTFFTLLQDNKCGRLKRWD